MNVNKRMKILITLSLVFFVSSTGATENDTSKLPLDNGYILHITEISPSRVLPYAFYDQAMESIPSIYPNSVIVAERRIGSFAGNSHPLYSLIAYKKSMDLKNVTISGVVTGMDRAWSFNIKVTESSYANTLLLILEKIANLPYNQSLQKDPGKVSATE
jgi:hypothetical protein